MGDRDRIATLDAGLHGLSPRPLRVAVGARAGQTQGCELEPDAHTVLEQHLDVGLTIDFDGLDVMGGHGSTLR